MATKGQWQALLARRSHEMRMNFRRETVHNDVNTLSAFSRRYAAIILPNRRECLVLPRKTDVSIWTTTVDCMGGEVMIQQRFEMEQRSSARGQRWVFDGSEVVNSDSQTHIYTWFVDYTNTVGQKVKYKN